MKFTRYQLLHLSLLAQFPLAYAEPLSLSRAGELAAQNSHAAKSSEFAVQEAAAREKQLWRTLGPRVEIESTLAAVSESTNQLVGKQLGVQNIPNKIETASLVVAQPITAMGPLVLKAQAEALATRAAAHQQEQTLRNAKFAGGEAFLKATKAQHMLEIAKASMLVAQKQKADGKALAQVGKLKTSDLLRLDLAVSESQTQLSQAELARDVAFYILAELTGLNASDLQLENTVSRSVSQNANASQEHETTLLDKAIGTRSEVQSLQASIQGLELAQKAQRFDYAPQLQLFARYERDFAKKDVTIPPAHTHDASSGAARIVPGSIYKYSDIRDNLTYGLTLKWNIWDWGTRCQKESELASKEGAARENLELLKQTTRIEVVQSQRDLQACIKALGSAQATLTFAEEVYRQTNARFLMGMSSVLDLTSAERDQTRARASLSNTRGDCELAALKLKKVVGDDSL